MLRLSERKRHVLRDRNYVFLEGQWLHKGSRAALPHSAICILGDNDFENNLERYVRAKERLIHANCFGIPW